MGLWWRSELRHIKPKSKADNAIKNQAGSIKAKIIRQ